MKVNVKKGFLITLAVFSTLFVVAQQEAMFTHYMFNTMAVNPGYAGSRDALTVTALNRSQWIGFEGAPTTQTLTVHTPLMAGSAGAGLSMVNDQIGPLSNTSVFVDLAYRLKLSRQGTLAFGLKGGVNVFRASLSDLTLEDESDPNFQQGIRSLTNPNIGFGVYYSTQRFYAGLSAPKLIENDLEGVSSGTEKRHFYLSAGSVFDLSDRVKIKPTTLIKATSGAPVQADLTATFLLDDRYWAGAMFRGGDAAGILLGATITQQLAVGYSFDFSYANSTFEYNLGSHEIMLRYDFFFGSSERVKSPRYF